MLDAGLVRNDWGSEGWIHGIYLKTGIRSRISEVKYGWQTARKKVLPLFSFLQTVRNRFCSLFLEFSPSKYCLSHEYNVTLLRPWLGSEPVRSIDICLPLLCCIFLPKTNKRSCVEKKRGNMERTEARRRWGRWTGFNIADGCNCRRSRWRQRWRCQWWQKRYEYGLFDTKSSLSFALVSCDTKCCRVCLLSFARKPNKSHTISTLCTQKYQYRSSGPFLFCCTLVPAQSCGSVQRLPFILGRLIPSSLSVRDLATPSALYVVQISRSK